MQSQQLLTERQVFKDEVLPRPKALTIHPRRCRSNTIMARILSENPNRALRQGIHFVGVRRFGETQGTKLGTVRIRLFSCRLRKKPQAQYSDQVTRSAPR